MDSAAGYEKERRVYRVFEQIAAGYDRANDRISFGLQSGWKRMLTEKLAADAPPGAGVLDVCCGTGDIALEAARLRPDLQVTGLDFSPAMLRTAKRRGMGCRNVQFIRASAMRLPCPENHFAAACISFGLRNTADYGQVLGEMRRVVKPGGWVYCLDSFVPENRLVQPFYRLYFRHLMPLIGGGTENASAYRWLNESTEQFLCRDALKALFREAGLRQVQSESRMFGACTLVWGRV